jgi:hypothetical protein
MLLNLAAKSALLILIELFKAKIHSINPNSFLSLLKYLGVPSYKILIMFKVDKLCLDYLKKTNQLKKMIKKV